MKKYWRLILLCMAILAGYYLLEPGNRYLLLKYNSGNGYGRFYYDNGLWSRRLWLGSDFESELSYADLSPDGAQIVFQKKGTLYTYRILTGQFTPINNNAWFNETHTNRIQWSPDGRQIGFVCTEKITVYSAEICIFDVASQQLDILTNYGDYDTGETFVLPYFGSWGPNNDSVVYVLTTNPNVNGETVDSIKIINTRNRHVDTVLDEAKANLAINRDPALSPDGKTILFSAAVVGETYGNYEIYQINVDGSDLHQLVGIDGLYMGNPVWSPDGRSFYATSADGTYFKPIHFNLDGKRLMNLCYRNQRTLISWRVVK